MKNSKLDKEKDIAFNSHLKASEYSPKPINFKKLSIILASIAIVITTFALLWFFVFKGKDYLDYKDTSKKSYNQIFVETNKQNDLQFRSDTLKKNTLSLIDDLDKIYKAGGFSYTAENGAQIASYKYNSDRKFEIISIATNDYLFGFVDPKLSSFIPQDPKNHFPTNMSNRISIRIIDNKISAVGFRYDSLNENKAGGYRWLKGSYTKGMVGR